MSRPSPTSRLPDLDGLAGAVRAHDRDRHLSALLAPEPLRTHLLVLYAFDAEMARIPTLVREPMLGQIRLQWWRDQLQGLLIDASGAGQGSAALGAAPPSGGAPLCDAILALARQHGLPGGLLHGLIDAREPDLEPHGLADEGELRAHIAKTDVAVVDLALRLTGGPLTSRRAAFSEAAGLAIGITRRLRHLAYDQSRGGTCLPRSLLSRHGIDPERPAGEVDRGSLRAAIGELAHLARSEARRARAMMRGLPRGPLFAVLPLALVEPYLRQIESPGHDPLRHVADINPLRRAWLVLRAHALGRV